MSSLPDSAEASPPAASDEPKPARTLGPLRMIWRETLRYPRQVAIALIALATTSTATMAIPDRFRVIVDHRPRRGTKGTDSSDFEVVTEATIKVVVDGERLIATAEGNGPVNALDQALRQAIGTRYPAFEKLHLTDFKVRVLDTSKATGAVTRVLIDSTNGDRSWSTIGVSENIIEASWEALLDSIVYGLFHTAADS